MVHPSGQRVAQERPDEQSGGAANVREAVHGLIEPLRFLQLRQRVARRLQRLRYGPHINHRHLRLCRRRARNERRRRNGGADPPSVHHPPSPPQSPPPTCRHRRHHSSPPPLPSTPYPPPTPPTKNPQ